MLNAGVACPLHIVAICKDTYFNVGLLEHIVIVVHGASRTKNCGVNEWFENLTETVAVRIMIKVLDLPIHRNTSLSYVSGSKDS